MTLGIKASMVLCVLTMLACILLLAVPAPAQDKTPVYDRTATVKFLSGQAYVEATAIFGTHDVTNMVSTTCSEEGDCYTSDGPPIEGGCQVSFQPVLTGEDGNSLGSFVDYMHPYDMGKWHWGNISKWNPLVTLCTQPTAGKSPVAFKFRFVTNFETPGLKEQDRLDKSAGNPVQEHYGICLPYNVLGKHGEVKKILDVCYALE